MLPKTFDPALSEGARNAVRTCLSIQPDEKVTLITDTVSSEIAAAIAHQLTELGCRWNAFCLEEMATRPLAGMPLEILTDMETSQVSIFAVVAQQNELKSRMEMTDVVNRRKMRHAHMVNIEKRIMLEGMRADFLKVDALSVAVWKIASQARQIRATTAAGTNIVADMNPHYHWLKTSGIISPNKWGNLPGGECFTTPGEVNGTFVIDGVVGDYLCAKYGDLRSNPLTIRIEKNRLVSAASSNQELRDEFWAYCHTDENSDRVGEFAIGTNLALQDVIGNILQDEKIPGIHIAFGNPYGAHTGADWYSATHIDVVGRRFNIWIDDRQIMRDGEFLITG
ncbi:aminopeptidase [Bryobacter aggregatus]|uniref:aminopeptidase n=1 Tax=Bryobacter aggregatus TaxID=360054 RepID=UPI0004E28C50|nr:aminopeptidase [Bryobacter aggregatus]